MTEHRHIAVDDTTLHVAVAGPADGPAVVLLHGWPHTWLAWRHVAPALVEAGYRAVMPDLPGLGASTIPPAASSSFDKMSLARPIAGLVRELALGPVVVVGHDWGGVVAFYTAWLLQQQEEEEAGGQRIRGLAVVDVTIPNALGAGPDIAQGGTRWHHAFHRSTVAERLVDGRVDLYLNWFYDTFAHTPAAIDPDTRRSYIAAYSRPDRMRAGFEYYRAMDQDVAHAATVGERGLTMPVLALGGAIGFGRREEPLECLRFFAAEAPTGGAIPNCGHCVPEEAPDALLEYLLPFVRRCLPQGG